MIPPFRFDIEELEEIKSELDELIDKIKAMNERSELYSERILKSGVSEEDIMKIFDILSE